MLNHFPDVMITSKVTYISSVPTGENQIISFHKSIIFQIMAEAYLNKNFSNTTITKKRKNDGNHQSGGKKRSHTVGQVSEDIILLDPRPQRKVMEHVPAADSVAAAAAAVRIEADISYVQLIQSNSGNKRSFHIGGKQYLIFAGPNGLIQNIHFKEWDGQKVLNQGITLNIPKIMMVMHYGQQISNQLDRITSGAKDIDIKKHIGGGFYLNECKWNPLPY